MIRLKSIPLCLAVMLLSTQVARSAERPGRPDDKKDEKKGDEFSPVFDRSTLHVSGRSLKPVGVKTTPEREFAAGELRVVFGEKEVRALRAGRDAPVWTAKAPDDIVLAWLAADDKAIYLAGYQRDKNTRRYKPESPARVRRLDPASGKWLDDLKLEVKANEGVEGVLTGNGRVAVLTVAGDEPDAKPDQAGAYRVSYFDAGATKARWSKSFASAGKLASPGVFLLAAARMPDKVQPAVRPLSWLGQDVLVCAGPVQDVLCLKADSGEPRWRVPRVWEYERGFIGPSVWQHFIARGGDEKARWDELVGEKKDKKEEKKEEKEEKKDEKPARQSAIVGGPIIVEGPKDRREKGASVFVAVAKGPARFAEYLSDCVVYELDASGKPVAMVTLPRMVRGGAFRALDGGVVWACQGGGFVRLAASRDRDRPAIGPGGPDMLCEVDWFRQLPREKPEAWLTSDPAGDPVALGERVAFGVRTGGYIPDAAGGVYHFPISVLDLETGATRSVELRIPYTGKVPEPKTNFGRTTTPGGKEALQAHGPYMMAVTGLAVEGKRLRVIVGTETGASALDFDTDELLESEPK